jgi:hypothetical protein
VGRNPKARLNLGASHASALAAVLAELSGKEPEFMQPATEQQCKVWAALLKENLSRVKLIKGVNKRGRKYGFLVVQGADIEREFSNGHYKHDAIDFVPSWEMANDLDGEWRLIVSSFIEFLDTCGGIVKVV